MSHLSRILASTFLTIHLLAVKTSAEPSIPNAFFAQISFYMEGYQRSADIYVNYEMDNVLLVSNLGMMTSDAGQSYLYISGSEDYTMAYRYLETFDSCMRLPSYAVGYFSVPQLNKLENATYVRSHSFMGRLVDVWSYSIMSYQGYTETYEIAFLTSDYETPVYLISPGFGYPVIINSFSDVPPPLSRFTLPYQCTMAKQSMVTEGKAKVKKSKFHGHNFFNIKDI